LFFRLTRKQEKFNIPIKLKLKVHYLKQKPSNNIAVSIDFPFI